MGHIRNFVTVAGLSIASLAVSGERATPQSGALSGYGLPFTEGINPETICGVSNDLQHVERYNESEGIDRAYVAAHEPSTVQLQWLDEAALMAKVPDHSPGRLPARGWCTGTLISADTVLTAGHCFTPLDAVGGWTTPYAFNETGHPVFAPPEELAKLQVVRFGYQLDAASGGIRIPRTFEITRLVERRVRDGIDYAIVALAPDQDGKRPGDYVSPAEIAVRPPVNGETVALIQHPQGDLKQIDAGKITGIAGPLIHYDDIDTLGAASGAALRDADGKVIGVHVLGDCESFANSAVSTLDISKVSDAF